MVRTVLFIFSALLIFLCACPSSSPSISQKTTKAASLPSNTESDRIPNNSIVDLSSVLQTVPEYQGPRRNLFIYRSEQQRQPSANNLNTAMSSRTADATPGDQLMNRMAAHKNISEIGTATLNIKYAGFVEKTGPAGEKSKYAIFFDGNDIFTGAEGEIIANRFTVVQIGLESVTISSKDSDTTERIPLQVN